MSLEHSKPILKALLCFTGLRGLISLVFLFALSNTQLFPEIMR